MSGPLPAAGYISNSSRTVLDAQNEWELDIAVQKETLGGFSEGSTLSITSNSITPVNNACVCPVDASGGGTINTIQTTNIRDGQVIFLHCVSSGDPITIANLASGSGAPIATFSGQNIVLSNPAMFISLKYNATTNKFQEVFPYPTWAEPGAIGSTTPNTGAFTSLTLTGNVSAHQWLGNSSSSSAAPTFSSITAADLPSTSVNSSGNLSPLFTTSVSSQALSFSLSNASAGQLFGNFSGSTGAPSFNAPGSADQILGVAHTGGGLEYKTLIAGANISITPAAGSITIAASGGGATNPMTTLGDTIYGASGGTETRLAGNTSSTKEFLTQTGTGSASAAPAWGALASGDIPWAAPGTIGSTTPNTGKFTSLTLTGNVSAHQWLGNSSSSSAAPTFSSITAGDLPSTTVNSSGNLSPLFTTSASSQALSFSLSNAAAGQLFGNFSGSSGAPSFNAPGSADQILGVAHTGGGLEYKTITAGANISITPAAGSVTISASGGGATNPMTTLGDTIYGASGGTETRLAGNTSTAKQFLTQTGSGSASAAPAWGALASGDIPWSTPGTIGSTTPNTGAFTTISATGAITQTASTTEGAAPQNQGPIAAPQDVTVDGVVQGLNTYTSSSLTATLNTSPNSSGGYAVMIIQGNRVAIAYGDSRLAITVSASKDTYIDVSSSGTFTATSVSNGAAAPSTTTNNLRLCKIISGASSISAVDYIAPTVQQELPVVEWTSSGNYSDTSQSDGVICPISSLSTLSSLTTTMVPAGLGVLIIQGGRPYWIPVGDSRLTNTYTASKDTYIDFSAGSFSYTTVSNNASPPSLTSGYVRVGLVVSGASTITGGYWFGGSVSLVSGLGGGGNISTPNAIPTTGTWTGEYWQYGSFSTTGTITSNQGRIHVVGDVIINNAITVNTEMPGGFGTQWDDTFSMSGHRGAGLTGGANGVATAGGGGGGNGGSGGAGGSGGPGISARAPGGASIPFLVLTGSGGGAGGNGIIPHNPDTLNAGGAGGGGLYIEASGNIYVLANISANGAVGTSSSAGQSAAGGGGSGGCIELRAGGQVYVAAGVTLSAAGGAGGNSTSTNGGGGGGGGGGFIRLKGACINNQGTLSVAGGTGGTSGGYAGTAGSTGVTDTTAVVWGPRSPS